MGLARAVMLEAMARMVRDGIRTVSVSHDTENVAARRLYESLGFTTRYRTHGYRRVPALRRIVSFGCDSSMKYRPSRLPVRPVCSTHRLIVAVRERDGHQAAGAYLPPAGDVSSRRGIPARLISGLPRLPVAPGR
jgi:hypothetical protein